MVVIQWSLKNEEYGKGARLQTLDLSHLCVVHTRNAIRTIIVGHFGSQMIQLKFNESGPGNGTSLVIHAKSVTLIVK